MIDWIDQRLRSWGRQMRHIYLGKDGWPSRTALHKLIHEGVVGAASSRFSQQYPEFLGEEEVEINNAVKTLGEREREILFVKYIVGLRPKAMMQMFDLDRRRYYECLGDIHETLTESLNSMSRQNSHFCTGFPTRHSARFRAT